MTTENKIKKKKNELAALQREVPKLIKDVDKNVELDEVYQKIRTLGAEIYSLQIALRKK